MLTIKCSAARELSWTSRATTVVPEFSFDALVAQVLFCAKTMPMLAPLNLSRCIQVDVHQSPELKKALGVRAVPTVKLHAGLLGQVASFTCGPRKVCTRWMICTRVGEHLRRFGLH